MANSVYKTYEVTIDTMQDIGSSKTIRYSQNDLNSAKLLINIQHGGKELDLSSATAVRISFRKQDRKLVYQDCQPINALSGKYQVVLNTQTLVVTGKVEFQVHIELPSQKIDTQKFFFVVDESLMNDEIIESTNEFSIIEKAIEVGEKFEGKDIDGIIVAGAKADTAITKSTENANQIGNLDKKAKKSFEENKKAVSPFYDSSKPMFTIIDDDAQTRFFDITKPILDARGIKVSFAVITNRVGTSGYMTKEQLLQLQDEGHEIVSHSTNHDNIYNDDTTTDSVIESSLKDSQKWLMENGFNGYETFVYPFGAANARAKKLTGKYYKHGIRSSGDDIKTFPYDNLQVPRKGIRANEDFATVLKPVIDSCFSNKGWLVFLTHSGISTEITTEYLTQAIDYVLGLGGVFLPFSEALKYKGNALSIGDFASPDKLFISNAGKVSGLDKAQNIFLGGLLTTANAIDNLRSTYQDGKITVSHIATGASGSMNEGGLLITNSTDQYYTYQIFITPTRMFTRRWDTASSNWKSWVEYLTTDKLTQDVNKTIITGASTKTMDDPITAYTQWKETIVMIASDKDTFKTQGGIMKVTRLDPYYSFATFKPSQENTVYTRKWQAGSSNWGAWGV